MGRDSNSRILGEIRIPAYVDMLVTNIVVPGPGFEFADIGRDSDPCRRMVVTNNMWAGI